MELCFLIERRGNGRERCRSGPDNGRVRRERRLGRGHVWMPCWEVCWRFLVGYPFGYGRCFCIRSQRRGGRAEREGRRKPSKIFYYNRLIILNKVNGVISDWKGLELHQIKSIGMRLNIYSSLYQHHFIDVYVLYNLLECSFGLMDQTQGVVRAWIC